MPTGTSKFKTAVIILLAATFAGLTIHYMLEGEKQFRDHIKQKKIEDVKRIDIWLDEIQQDVMTGRLSSAPDELSVIKKMNPNKQQQKKRLIILAELALKHYSQNLDNPQKRLYYSEQASKFLRLAKDLSDNRAEKGNIGRRAAQIYIEEGQRTKSAKSWQKALDILTQTRKYMLKPEERWEILLDEAECLKNLGEINGCIQMLNKIIDETETEHSLNIRAFTYQAQRRKADLYYSLWQDSQMLQEYNKKQAAQKQPILEAKTAMKKAVAIYNKLLSKLSPISPEIPYTQLGLLRIYTKQENKPLTYKLVNLMLESQMPPAVKAQALNLLATMQEKLNQPEKAIKTLEIAQKSYDTDSTSELIATHLYELYFKQKQYDKLLRISYNIFTRHPNLTLVQRIINDIFLGKSEVMTYINTSPQPKKSIALQDMQNMFNFVRDKYPAIWGKIKNEAQFIFAQLQYYMGRYKRADIELEKCLNTPGNSRSLSEAIAYLDIQCGLKRKRPDGISICRSLCYLSIFPKGAHYKDVLEILLDKYFDSGMYQEALNIAKKIYVDEITKLNTGNNDDFNKELWLKTVAKIGQCYDKLGSYDNSNRIIKAYSFQLMDQPFAPSVFLDWSNAALKQKQLKEAIRRLTIILPKIKDHDKYLKIDVARFLLTLKEKPYYPYSKCRTLLRQIKRNTTFAAEEKEMLLKSLYEEIIKYALSVNNNDIAYTFLQQAIKDFPTAKWPEYWTLNYLTNLYEKANLQALAQYHAATLDKELIGKQQKPETYNFIKNQLNLLNSLDKIEQTTKKIKAERGL